MKTPQKLLILALSVVLVAGCDNGDPSEAGKQDAWSKLYEQYAEEYKNHDKLMVDWNIALAEVNANDPRRAWRD